jgi:hypothetical protein
MRGLLKRVRASWQQTTPTDFANWSAGLQSLLIGFGVLLGAFWTVYLFLSLNQKEGAANQLLKGGTELRMLQVDLARAEEERGRAFGQVWLSTVPVGSDTLGNCFLQVNATIANSGSRLITLRFRSESSYPPLNVASVSVEDDGAAKFNPIADADVYSFNPERSAVYELREASLQPGEQSSYPFLLKLRPARLYLIQFSVPVDVAASDTSNAPNPDPDWHWAARMYTAGCSTTAAELPRGADDGKR